MRRLLVIPLLLVGLVGCGYHPNSGTVVGKTYSPPYTHTDQNCAMYSSSTPGLCMIYTYDTVTDPPSWRLTLRHCKDYKPYPQNCKTGTHGVGEAEYLNYQKGEHYP